MVFWRWWTAGAVSSLGTAVTAVALPLTALLALDATPFEMGVIAAASYVAWLVIGLPSGVIVQRLPLRGLQIACDLARAVAVASIPLAWWWGYLTVAHLVVTALVISFSAVLFDVANSTFLVGIVDKEQLTARNSLVSGTYAVTQLGGPTVGGVAVQLLGAVPTLLVDTASYLISAALLRSLPARRAEAPDRWPPVGAMIREGWRFVSRHPIMAPCTWAATALCLAGGAQLALYPLYLVRVLHAPAGLVGFLLAVEGVGSLLGATLTSKLSARFGNARALLLSGAICVAGAALVPLGAGVVGYTAFAVGSAVNAAGVVVLSVITRTYRQTASPPDLLARVMATVRFVTWGAIPVGGLLSGWLAGVIGPRATMVLVIAVVAAAPVILLLSPVRGLRDLAEHSASTPPQPAAAVS
ncbi:MFS transporter [Dactylosporangium sp. NPDC051541]|uniref:MFS transporter n=1 Tax=Dactylosporangium sp. NPDC051541 TaxID=3363977 RepID=UPI003795FB1D